MYIFYSNAFDIGAALAAQMFWFCIQIPIDYL